MLLRALTPMMKAAKNPRKPIRKKLPDKNQATDSVPPPSSTRGDNGVIHHGQSPAFCFKLSQHLLRGWFTCLEDREDGVFAVLEITPEKLFVLSLG